MYLVVAPRASFLIQDAEDDDAADPVEPEGEQNQETEGLSARQLFKLLRGNFGNTAEFANDLFTESMLQETGRIIANSLGPLHEEYSHDFSQHKKGQEGMMELQALKAGNYHYQCVTEILENMTHPRWIQHLSLAGNCIEPTQALDPESASMQADISLLSLLFQFSMHLASARCWSQAYLSGVMPYMVAGVHHPDSTTRDVLLLEMQNTSSTILALEDHVAANKADATAGTLLKDLSTCKWQVTREVLVMGEACSWSATNPGFGELKAYAWALFASPSTTKDILESAFGWLKDALRFTKASVMSFLTKFLYLLACPYAEESGVKVFSPSQADFLKVAENSQYKTIKGNLFNPKSKDLDKEVLPTAGRVQEIRPASFHTNRNAAAAMAFARDLLPRGFHNIPPSWPGSFRNFKLSNIISCDVFLE